MSKTKTVSSRVKGLAAGGLLGLAAAGGLAALYAVSLAREQVQLDRYTIRVAKPGIPRSGLTVLHLTDFHFREGGRVQARKLARLQEALAGETYDVAALTGDLIHDTGGLPTALALIDTLSPRYGTFFVPGNHDYAEYTPWGVLSHTWRQGAGGSPSLADVRASAARPGRVRPQGGAERAGADARVFQRRAGHPGGARAGRGSLARQHVGTGARWTMAKSGWPGSTTRWRVTPTWRRLSRAFLPASR